MSIGEELVGRLKSRMRRMEFIVRGGLPGLVAAGEVEGVFAPEDDESVLRWLEAEDRIAGLSLHGKGWRKTWGDDLIRLHPQADLTLEVRAGLFTQVNPQMNRLLVNTVLERARLTPESRVIDLYAGVGNLSLPIARRARKVVAVEQNRRAAADAVANSKRLGISNLRVIAATTKRALYQLRGKWDTVVLDPPRNGAAEAIEGIFRFQPKRLIYVSCDPATLARDCKRLAEHYRIESVVPLDLFPQTYHVETVVSAVLTC